MTDITSLYWTGVVKAQASIPGPYDPTRPQKLWEYPPSAWPAGVDGSHIFSYHVVDRLTAAVSPASMSYEEAARANVYDRGQAANPPVEEDATEIPWPVDLDKLPQGASIVPNPMAVFGQEPVVQPAPVPPTAPSVPSVDAAMQVRILNGINMILTALGKRTV